MWREKIIEWLGHECEVEECPLPHLYREHSKEVLTEAVKDLFNTLGPDDILREEKGQIWFGDRPLMDAEVNQIKAETTTFLQTKLWKVLQYDIKHQANKKMFVLGEKDIDFIAGKLWMYTLDVIRTRLASISKGKGSFNVK